jgi:hypothetical protein
MFQLFALHSQNLCGVYSTCDSFKCEKTVLELRGEGEITDSSPSLHNITKFGNVQISPQGILGNSIAFDGNGDYLIVPNSSDFDFLKDSKLG